VADRKKWKDIVRQAKAHSGLWCKWEKKKKKKKKKKLCILSQMKLANILPPTIVEDPVCINLTFTSRSSKLSVPFRSFDKIRTRL